MAWQASQALLGRESRPFRPTRTRLLVALYALALLAGQFVLSRDLLTPVTFPPFHTAATVLPPLIMLCLVGGALGGSTRWRDIDLQLGSGAFLSTTLAFLLELVVLVSVVMIVLVLVTLQPDGLEQIQVFLDQMQDPAWFQDPSGWAPLARSPVVVALALLVAAVAIPIIEEAVKTVGVGLAFYRRPGLAEAFLWGLACGAGFSLVEGMLSTTTALESWAAVVLLRVGATMLHCVTGGLMGIAWYTLLAQRDWFRAVALYVASVSIHGTWNALTVTMTLVSVSPSGGSPQGIATRFAGTSTTLILSLLLSLSLASGFGLAVLTRYARNWNQQNQTHTRPAGIAEDGPSSTRGVESRTSHVKEDQDA
jgi:RsiW-degrading membrane proteinase PrsW (M82 family)